MAVNISDRCSGCGACLVVCPFGALTLHTDQPRGRGRKKLSLIPAAVVVAASISAL